MKDYAGSGAKGGNRITLLRHVDGKPMLRTTFLDHLNALFGVTLVGADLYVANTDAIIRYPYSPDATHIDAPSAD